MTVYSEESILAMLEKRRAALIAEGMPSAWIERDLILARKLFEEIAAEDDD